MYVLNGNTEKIVGLLKSCGLSEYESKAYFVLLLAGRTKIGRLARMCAVPNSKIYLTVYGLEEKGLVEIGNGFPKVATARQFEPYLSDKINSNQKEISNLIENGNLIREMVYCLRPVVIKHKEKCRVFEPKYRRKTF